MNYNKNRPLDVVKLIKSTSRVHFHSPPQTHPHRRRSPPIPDRRHATISDRRHAAIPDSSHPPSQQQRTSRQLQRKSHPAAGAASIPAGAASISTSTSIPDLLSEGN
ncbi:hypothetical protein KY284_011307 [Solanum tuberosum]|nr:hypothetical protein KY284_011307 [Solanum tuberosum]